MKDKIRFYEFKIKERTPKAEEVQENKKSEGLGLMIMFVQRVNDAKVDREMSVREFVSLYNDAVSRSKLNKEQ